MIAILKAIIIPLSLIGAVLGVILIIFDGDVEKIKSKLNIKGESKNKASNKQNKDKKSKANKNKKEKINISDTQSFLDFDEIKTIGTENPVGLIVRGNEYIGVVEVSGINFNLLSIAERNILEDSFSKLLNGIDYPIQIYIQSKKIDIEQYIKKYEAHLEELKKEIEKTQNKIQFYYENNEKLEEIPRLQDKLNRLVTQFQYGININNFIIETCREKYMLDKKYYIVITHKHNSSSFNEKLSKEEELADAFFNIANKANSLIIALQRAKMNGKLLSGVELAEMLYIAYNKADSEILSLRKALRSGFSHYWTTAQPVDLKLMKNRLKELEKEKNKIDKELEKIELREGA